MQQQSSDTRASSARASFTPLLDKYVYTKPMPCSTHAGCVCSGRSSATRSAPRLGWVPIEEEQAQRGGRQRQHEVQAEKVAVAYRGAVSGVARKRPQVVECYLHIILSIVLQDNQRKKQGRSRSVMQRKQKEVGKSAGMLT